MASAKAQIARSDATIKTGKKSLAEHAKDVAIVEADMEAHDARLNAEKYAKADEASKAEAALSQAEKFEKAARDLGADQDEDAFKGVLRKLAKSKS